MIFKQSLKNIRRSGGKSVLFAVLILLLTVVFSLGVSVWVSIGGFLSDCEAEYRTIAFFEYMGTEYPDDSFRDAGVDAAIAELSAETIEALPGVNSWHSAERALAKAEGYEDYSSEVFAPEFGALVVKYTGTSMGYYSGLIIDTLYSHRNVDGMRLRMYPESTPVLEQDHYYLMAGNFIYGYTSDKYFGIGNVNFAAAQDAGVALDDELMCVDITDADGGWSIPDDSIIPTLAESMRVLNNQLLVSATGDIGTLLPFHQKDLYITSGREFTAEEYSEGAAVCIVSDRLCAKLGVGLGDSISLAMAVSATAPTTESYWAGVGFEYADEFTIVGITNTLLEYSSCVFIPTNAQRDFSANHSGYSIGTAVLDNSSADEFYAAVQGILPDRVVVNVYDQGYATVAAPFRDILSVAIIVTIVCGLVALAVLILFGYLFVYRQREVSQIMIRLGAGKRRTRLYFLYGSGLIALIAAAVGAVIGSVLSGRVGALVQSFAIGYSSFDTHFSNGNLSIIKPLAYSPELPMTPFILVGAAVFLLAVLSCFYFTERNFSAPQKKKKRVRTPAATRSSTMRGGAIKYSLLSIKRGGARGVASPLLAFMAALFLCQLVTTAVSYETQLERIYEDTVIDGALTDSHGRQTGNVVITGYTVNTLARSGYIDNIALAKPIIFAEYDSIDTATLGSGFSLETFLANRARAGRLVFTNSIADTPEFYYSNTKPEVRYLDGYDESFLSSAQDGRKIASINDNFECVSPGDDWYCLVSSAYLKEHGLSLGDSFMVMSFENGKQLINLKIIGEFDKQSAKDNIYVELGLYMAPEHLFSDDAEVQKWLGYWSFYSMSFTVPDATTLTGFKQMMLESNFSEPSAYRQNRSFVILQDKSFLATVGTIKQQIEYIGVLYPVLYGLTFIVGLVAAYLLILSRKRELAIMRGLGAGRRRAFMSLFWEQAALCTAGCALGLGAAAALGTLTAGGAGLAGIFALCWFIGSCAAAVGMNGPAVLGILREEE